MGYHPYAPADDIFSSDSSYYSLSASLESLSLITQASQVSAENDSAIPSTIDVIDLTLSNDEEDVPTIDLTQSSDEEVDADDEFEDEESDEDDEFEEEESDEDDEFEDEDDEFEAMLWAWSEDGGARRNPERSARPPEGSLWDGDYFDIDDEEAENRVTIQMQVLNVLDSGKLIIHPCAAAA